MTPAVGYDAKRRRRIRLPSVVLVLAAAVALLTLLPIALVVEETVSGGWHEAKQLLVRPLVGTLLLQTTELILTATAAVSLIGVVVAWLVERTDLPGRRVWAVVAALPITVPPFVTSYSWVTITPRAEGFWGAALIVTLAYYPFVYLPVAVVLRRMDPALEDSARSLGLGPWRTFFRVTLPQLKLALLGGALIVAIHLLSEFGAFAMLRFRTFTTAIYDEYRLSFDGPAAASLASVLLLLCLLLLVGERYARTDAPQTKVGTGAMRRLAPARLGLWKLPALLAMTALVAASLGVPVVTLIYWMARDHSALPSLGSVLRAAGTSLWLSFATALVTTLLALPVAFAAVRRPGRLATIFENAAHTSPLRCRESRSRSR